MLEPPKHIRGVGRVLSAFGYWPSFHNAGIEDVRIDRSEATLTFTLRAFAMTNETDARGDFRLTKHHDVHLRFEDIADVTIPERDDTLFALVIGNELDAAGRFLVEVESAIGSVSEGYGGTLRARSGNVVKVVRV